MDLWLTLLENFYANLYEDPMFSGGAKNYVPLQRVVIWLLTEGKIYDLQRNDQNSVITMLAPVYPVAVKNIVGSRENLDKIHVEINPDISHMWNSLSDTDKEIVRKISEESMRLINTKHSSNMTNLLPPLKVAESAA